MAKIAYLLVVMALVLTGCGGTANSVEPRCTQLAANTVFIQTATQTEWDAVKEALGEASNCTWDNIPYVVNNDVAAFLGGVGPDFAGASTESMLSRFKPMALLFSGTAGALSNDAPIGQTYIVETWYDRISGSAVKVSTELFQLAKRSLTNAQIVGNGVTSPTFVSDPAEASKLSNEFFAARIVDMEDYTVANGAAAHNVQFLSVRTVSDMANGTVVKSNRKLAASNSAKIAVQLAKMINAK